MLLRDNVYQNLRSDILSCPAGAGRMDMREQDLAVRYAVSRQPVREALLRLGGASISSPCKPRQGLSGQSYLACGNAPRPVCDFSAGAGNPPVWRRRSATPATTC